MLKDADLLAGCRRLYAHDRETKEMGDRLPEEFARLSDAARRSYIRSVKAGLLADDLEAAAEAMYVEAVGRRGKRPRPWKQAPEPLRRGWRRRARVVRDEPEVEGEAVVEQDVLF